MKEAPPDAGATFNGELLRASDLRVIDIAFQCGFQSSQYFATGFRKYAGTSPAMYPERLTD